MQIQGAQAPLPPGAVTATPAAGGAVDVSWSPSPSTGVAGYVVQRSVAGSGSWQPIGGLTSGTTAVDQTGTDGTTYAYQVVAQAVDVTPVLQSAAGGSGSAVTDASAPAPPAGFGDLPPFVNLQDSTDPFKVTVNLAPGSVASDTIAVTLHGPNGGTLTQTTNGGGATAQVTFNAVGQLADGAVSVSATATDSVGNTSAALADPTPFTLDTIAPGDPAAVTAPDLVTQKNDSPMPVQVDPTAPSSPTDVVHVSVSGPSGPAAPPVTGSPGDASIPVDVSTLPDGLLTVTAWITDAAGNSSARVSSSTIKDTAGPDLPTDFGVAAGPNNPAGVVTAASQSAVTIEATFAQPPDPTDTMTIWVAGTPYDIPVDGQSATITLGPLDLSSLPDDTYKLGMVLTDANGNASKGWTHFVKDTSGPEKPTSVGVPAGPNNPAGYVNAATQTAATIVAAFASPTNSSDQIALSVGGLDLGTQQGGGDTASWTGDLSSLPDGTLQILGTITDAAGNTSDFSGTLIKDTQPPPAPAFAQVVGPPPNVIGPSTASCVKVAVLFNQAPDPADIVTVTLSDENTSVEGSAPAGNGQVTVGCIDASSLSAGHIAVNVTVTDAAGNSTSTTGTTAVKLNCMHG